MTAQRAAGDQRQQPALPGRVEPRVPAGMPQRGGVVEDHDDVARGDRREVRRAQQDVGAGGLDRQHELLPRMAGAVRQRGRRRERPSTAAARTARAPSARRRRAPVAPRRERRSRSTGLNDLEVGFAVAGAVDQDLIVGSPLPATLAAGAL